MRSISLPGLVLWLPLGSPAACSKRTRSYLQPVIRKRSLFPISRLALLNPRTAQGLPRVHHTALTLQTPSLTKVHLKAPLPPSFGFLFTALCQNTFPFLTRPPPVSGGGPQVTRSSRVGRFIAFYNLCSPFYNTSTLHLIPTQE